MNPVEDNKNTQQVANTAAPAPERSENSKPSEQIKPTQPQQVEASMPESNNLPQNNAIRIALKNKDASIQSVNGAIVNAIRPFLYENTEREPIIIPMILTPDEE